jgi:hypothetical protein
VPGQDYHSGFSEHVARLQGPCVEICGVGSESTWKHLGLAPSPVQPEPLLSIAPSVGTEDPTAAVSKESAQRKTSV